MIRPSHKGMIDRMLHFFGMSDCTISVVPFPKGTDFSNCESSLITNLKLYHQLFGEISHLCNTTDPNIAYETSYLSLYKQKPTTEVWNESKTFLRYFEVTRDFLICYRRTGPVHVVGYSDADWSQETPKRKSIGGYTFIFPGGSISWKIKKKSIIAKKKYSTI